MKGESVPDAEHEAWEDTDGLRDEPDAVLPDEARNRLMSWLADAKEELAELKDDGEIEQAAMVEEKIQAVEKHLKQCGFGKHSSNFQNRSNRDRNSVSKAIKSAIKAIAMTNPSLARHLSNSIRTGFNCCYQPEKPTKWVFK